MGVHVYTYNTDCIYTYVHTYTLSNCPHPKMLKFFVVALVVFPAVFFSLVGQMNDLYMSLRLAAFGSNINMINNTQYTDYVVVCIQNRRTSSIYGAQSIKYWPIFQFEMKPA